MVNMANSTIRGILCSMFCIVLLSSCKEKPHKVSSQERLQMEKRIKKVQHIDSFAPLQKQLEAEGDLFGSIVTLREWGKWLRNESKFDQALDIHNKGLRQAETIGDTIEWVQALNNMGTNYRRLGLLDVAQGYHYSAWKMSEASSDTSALTKKNRVVSLNGLGNIYMTLGNFQRADSVLRLALKGERALKSDFGQAINYANIGSIFEKKNQLDSAWVYYRKSMELNERVNSPLGISLCHTYFGSLYEKEKDYNKAYDEYQIAFEVMKTSKDEWHALTPLLALAHLDCAIGDPNKALEKVQKAETIATKINSQEHLAEIHDLYYQIYRLKGDYQKALDHHVLASSLKDSVAGAEKMNRIQNISLNIERKRQSDMLKNSERELLKERTRKQIIFTIASLVVFFLVIMLLLLNYIQRIRARNYKNMKKMNEIRENFFTNITHEFRTPLTVILGLSKDICTNELPLDRIREKALVIERQGKNLLTFINQLLDISKVKSSVGDPDWRHGNMTAYLTMIIESYRDYAAERKVELQFISKKVGEMDFVPDYINKIMNNILSNAFKFTPSYGTITVSVWQEGQELKIDISDTGCGIAPEALPHLFELFYQAEGGTKVIGSGIGLTLVKQIIDFLNGTISVESTLGRGTTFHLSLPIRQGEKHHTAITLLEEANTPMLPREEKALEDSQVTEEEDDSLRILIIEDNSDVANYIGDQLSKTYAIFYAKNGKEGLEKAQELVPDVIITDLMMPEMDGLEVCRRVRANEIISHIPIIIITAKITETDRVKGLEAGADAYLAKPFNSEELLMRVEKLLEQRHLLRKKYAQIVSLDPPSEESQENTYEQNSREENIPHENTQSDQQFLIKIVDQIYLSLEKTQEIDIETIAQEMCMSKRQFYRKISALTGYTPLGYIQRIKIRKAKLLLDKYPSISLKEVSEQCGFSDYSNFVRTFKNICNITPSQYIKKAPHD